MIFRIAPIFIATILVCAVPIAARAYDDRTTHPALTDEIVDFYNLLLPELPISAEEREWIVEGSILEDVPPRWINHFHDPIYDKGWSGKKTGLIAPEVVQMLTRTGLSTEKPVSASEWMNSYTLQEQYRPYGGNRSWQKGLEYFAEGNRKEAYRTLGHILHLLEDMSVPDHTRDDTHAHVLGGITGDPGSPYEEYAQRWDRKTIKNLRLPAALLLEGKAPPAFKAPVEYLTSLARYSNAYFFSKDTINEPKYPLPRIIRRDSDMAYGVDGEGVEFPIAKIKEVEVEKFEFKRVYVIEETDTLILDAYFHRLARQSILHGAGLIKLYQEAVRDAAVNKEFPQRLVKIDATRFVIPTFSVVGLVPKLARAADDALASVRNFFGGIAEAVAAWFRGARPGLPLPQTAPELVFYEEMKTSLEEDSGVPVKPPPALEAGVVASLIPALTLVKRVIDGDTIELEGGEIVRYIGIDAPEVAGTSKDPDCFALDARRRNEEMVLGKKISLEGIKEDRDEYGRLLRYVRIEDVFVNEILVREGYAKAFNFNNTDIYSEIFSEAEEAARAGRLGMWGIVCAQSEKVKKRESNRVRPPEPQCKFGVTRPPEHRGIVINEVAWMGARGRSGDEWVELKNRNDFPVDVGGWELVDKDAQIRLRFKSSSTIPAGGFYLLERTDDDSVPEYTADEIYIGSISNQDDGLRLFDSGCVLVDEVLAVYGHDGKRWPGGSSELYRTMERDPDGRGWHTYGGGLIGSVYGTPKAENGIPYMPVLPSGGGGGGRGGVVAGMSTISNSGKIVISELRVAGADAGDEFIELYNAEDFPVDLSGWSLQYVSGGGSSFSITKKNLHPGLVIDPKGFLLIARGKNASGTDGFAGSVVPDMAQRTISFSGSASGATLFLVNDTSPIENISDPNLVDRLAYGAGSNLFPEGAPSSLPLAGQSLERKAIVGQNCVSGGSLEGKFLGNSCDTGDNLSDFEIRSVSGPQSRTNLPEPRSGPEVQEFAAEYVSSTLSLFFGWESVRDVKGSTSTNAVKIYLGNSSTSIFESTSSLQYAARIGEVGMGYEYRVVAVDQDGMESESSGTILVPSFFDRLNIYPDPRAGAVSYLVDIGYSTPRFIPRIFSSSSPAAWQAMVFYINRFPNPQNIGLVTANAHEPADQDGVLRIIYHFCSSSATGTHGGYVFSIEMADCGSGGGLNNSATFPVDREDSRLLIQTSSSTADFPLAPSDFMTVAFYDFAHSGGGTQNLYLAAVDRTQYFFQPEAPTQAAPTAPLLQLLLFDPTASSLQLAWSTSTDADSADQSIRYEIALSTSSVINESAWVDKGTATSATMSVSYPSTYLVGVRAKDDFGTVSLVSLTEWSFPSEFSPLPLQSDSSEWVGTTLGLGQRVRLLATTTLDGVALWIGPDRGIFDVSQTFIELKNDNAGVPGGVFATSSIETVNWFDGPARRMFNIPPTEFSGGDYYWIIPQRVDGVNQMRLYGSAGDSYPDGFWAGDPGRDIYFQFRRS